MDRRALWFCLPLILAASIPAWGQSIPVPEAIRAEGVPPIPASVSQVLNRYQNIRSASFQDWASDGSGMYIITRFADTPQVHFVAAPGGARTQLTFLNDRVLSVSARPKHEQFLYVADEGGAENYQLFLQDRKGGEARRITDGKSRNSTPKWSPSGSLLGWSSNARNGRDMDIYVAAATDPHFVRRLKEVSGQWTVSDWSPDETRLVAVEYISINDCRIHIIDMDTGKSRQIAPDPGHPDAKPSYNSEAKWSRDGRWLYYITDRGQEYRYVVRSDLHGALTGLTYPNRDVEEFDVSDDGEVIAVVMNEGGPSQVFFNPFHTSAPEDVFENSRGVRFSFSPGGQVFRLGGGVLDPGVWNSGVISGLEFRPGSRVLGFTLSTARSAAEAYSFEITDREKRRPPARWTTSEIGGLDPIPLKWAQATASC
jgi:dipeptidyl aminopeptidase/acylaminoacyl peptidase